MRHRPFRYILLTTVLLFLWQACESEDSSVNASRLRLKLTDAASLVIKEFYVDIREVSVFLVDTASQEGKWVSLDFSRRRYDIFKLRNGKTVQLADQYVPAGTELQQIKLVFGNDNLLKTNTDSIIPLYIPAKLEEGVLIDAVKMEMRANTISSMVIDLNAALSVVRTEEGDHYLYPVARAFPEVFGGKLRGYVAPLEANPHVKIMQGENVFLSLPERENAGDQMLMFQFIGLGEGDWEVHFVPDPQANFSDTVVVVTVKQGETFNIPTKPIRLKRLSGE